MKKQFKMPEIVLVNIYAQDILTTSSLETFNDDYVPGQNSGSFTP